ncbi:hypothetical protein QQY24_15810 [Streptomyces sp. TG1A-8]|uniref:hypothetical protein n=1 Tax=Streptomyces sp. TG1A-8 TaxID=3051385 RepID=UPI00265BBD07|nr:hypothetical protein [Streptomyces sp. TG1A-8]MDO0926812.1 hypothetical protein [Streptomyces sp. TG1A-8]
MWLKADPDKQTLTPTEKTIRRTRRVLTGGRWFLITGLVFYSLMTTTPFVSAHSEWQWSGFVLGLIADAAFIMALSAESTLARHGVTQLGAWPVAFRWVTGMSSVFLNVWLSVAARDWVGVAVHLIAPALVMLLAEVGPVYTKALADAERDAQAETNTIPYTPHLMDAQAVAQFAETATATYTAPDGTAFDVELVPEADGIAVTLPEPEPEPARLSNKEANEIIEKGWRHRLSPEEVGKAANRHPATVRRKYKELDAALSV